MDLVSGFPKNLAYTLKQLANFTKQTVKVMPDRVNPSFGEVSRFKLPPSALIDFRTIAIYADVSLYGAANGTGSSYSLHLPRNTASLIQQFTITCNGVQLCNINDYNLFYKAVENGGAALATVPLCSLGRLRLKLSYAAISFRPPHESGVTYNTRT